jgi:beta-phosphoglucomutase
MYPDAVIFDFDGVIVNTEPIHYIAFQKILEPMNMGYDWEKYTLTYMGFDDRDAFREAFKTAGKTIDDSTLQQLIDKKAVIFEEIITRGVETYPGVIELITNLSKLNVPLAICSGALRSDIIPILNQLNIKKYFAHIVTAEDVPQSKPDPASYKKAKELLLDTFSENLNNSSHIYAIEDTPAGIESAKGAGLKVIGVTNSYSSEHLDGCNIILGSLAELFPSHWH